MRVLIINIVAFISLSSLSFAYNLDEEMKIAHDNDNPAYVDLWLEKNNDKSIKDYILSIDKVNISNRAIELGAKVDKKSWDNSTALYRACINNRYEIAKLLIERGANVNIKVGYSAHTNQSQNITPLHQAVITRNLKLVKLLVESGAKINAKDFKNRTPLYEAIVSGSFDVVKYLLEKKS